MSNADSEKDGKKMISFKDELRVNGKVIGGVIRNGEFYLNTLNPYQGIKPPIRTIEFTKEWLDICIEELKEVRNRM